MKTEAEIGRYVVTAKERQQPAKAGRSKSGFSHRALVESVAMITP